MPTLYAVRGLPGSGQSSLGSKLGNAVAADDWFTDSEGVYRFDCRGLADAHADCLVRTRRILDGGGDVAVCNTFSSRWELEPYIALAAERPDSVRLVVMDLYDAGLTDEALAARNLHGVPVAGIAAMRRRWEPDWRSGDPRHPSQR